MSGRLRGKGCTLNLSRGSLVLVLFSLGCRHIVATVRLPVGVTATTMTYDMEDFLKSCIARYREVVGVKTPLRNYSTPFLAEDHRGALAGAPGRGPVKECPWCYHAGPPPAFRCYANVDQLPLRGKVKAETSAGSDDAEEQSVETDRSALLDQGVLAYVACSLLMKGYLGRAVGTPGFTTSSQSPSYASCRMDVHMQFHDV